MAERKTKAPATTTKGATTTKSKATPATDTTPKAPVDATYVNEDLNLDVKVTVKNLAGWDVTFSRKHDGNGAVIITKEGRQRLSRNEIQAQINDGNKLFVGIGNGEHATIYIEDEATRKWVGFEDDNNSQKVFTDKVVEDLFAMSQGEFEQMLPYYIVTRAEKYALIEAIKRLGFNDYRKIVFATNYTGYKI